MRRRSIAISVVLCAALVSVAYGDWTITESTSNTGPGRPSILMRNVLSVRNNLPQQVTAMIKPTLAAGGCPAGFMPLTDLAGNASTLWTFEANEQVQFIVSGNFPVATPQSCDYVVDAGSGNTNNFTTNFNVGSAGSVDISPKALLFEPATPTESQTIYLENYDMVNRAYATVMIVDDTGPTNTLLFDGMCGGGKSCPPGTINAASLTTFKTKCTPGATPATGRIVVMLMPGGSLTTTWTCRKNANAPIIDIEFPSYTLKGTLGGTASTMVKVQGPDAITSAQILGNGFQFTAPGVCSNQMCTFMPALSTLTGVFLTIECNPATTQKTAQLKVTGQASPGDVDFADLYCVADSGASANKSSLDFGDVKVATTSDPMMFTITNLSSTQSVNVVVDTGHPDYVADACAAGCMLGPSATQDVNVQFKPSMPGENDRTLGLFVGGMQVAMVSLTGNGVGSRMRVTSHQTPYSIDFGTIGLGAIRARTVSLQADGNRSLNIPIGSPQDPPFKVSKQALDLGPGEENNFDITCQSSTAGTFSSMVTLMPGPADHLYATDTMKLDVACKVANTPVQIIPDDLDFGEVRKTAPWPTIDVMIFNPSAATIPLDYVRLANTNDPLMLVSPTETSLGPNQTVHAQITLPTTNEVTVQNALEVGVRDTANMPAQLVSPITGKVVTASAKITPSSLRLGSVCKNTPIEEPVKLVNTGTARLHAQPPEMQDPFALLFTNPTSYPTGGALLTPQGGEATATVRLDTSQRQMVSGELVWDVDVPENPLRVMASVEIKEDGTAVSPQLVTFDQIPIDERSERRSIRLENCGTTPSSIVVKGLQAVKGSAGAWQVQPPTLQAMLEPQEKRTIEVTFAPKHPGTYIAKILLEVDGVAQDVELTGEGLGDEVDRKSLYACSCEIPASPLSVVPLVIVVVCVVLPRRRRR